MLGKGRRLWVSYLAPHFHGLQLWIALPMQPWWAHGTNAQCSLDFSTHSFSQIEHILSLWATEEDGDKVGSFCGACDEVEFSSSSGLFWPFPSAPSAITCFLCASYPCIRSWPTRYPISFTQVLMYLVRMGYNIDRDMSVGDIFSNPRRVVIQSSSMVLKECEDWNILASNFGCRMIRKFLKMLNSSSSIIVRCS